jgi:predicted  nucleic acid-binding Zn-ribbon protein
MTKRGGYKLETTNEKVWIENEIAKLERELDAAESRKADARIRLDRAKAEYAAAQETAETAAGLIRYFRGELGFLNGHISE